jgi:hypothetical protein
VEFLVMILIIKKKKNWFSWEFNGFPGIDHYLAQ